MTTSAPPPAPSDEPIVPPRQMAAWRAFLTAHARLTDELARELRDRVGLPLTWYDVLVQLSEADEHRLRMQELADRVLLSKSGLTRLIDRMERDELVTRYPCEDDRRGTYAQMTDHGYDVIRGAAPTHLEGIREHFAAALGDDEADTIAAALTRVTQRLADPTAASSRDGVGDSPAPPSSAGPATPSDQPAPPSGAGPATPSSVEPG